MGHSQFVYVTYIRSTPEKVWQALTKPEFTRLYWAGTTQTSDWTAGSPWAAYAPDGRLWDTGEILVADYPSRLVLTWRKEPDSFPELKAEGHTRLTYLLEPYGTDSVKLTLTHEIDLDRSKMIEAVSQGWPAVLASLKTLLETGTPIAETGKWPEGL